MVLPISLLLCGSYLTCPASAALLMALSLVSLVLSAQVGPSLSPFFTASCSWDHLSSSLVILAIFISVLMLSASSLSSPRDLKLNSLIILLLMVLIGAFFTSSFISFYVFFEASLAPIALMVFGWGYQPERISAGLALMLYTMVASLPLLGTLILLGECFGSSMFLSFMPASQPSVSHLVVFVGLMAGFLVKFPMYLVHLWLPKAHVEAPVVGSMVLAALLLKLGGFGAWRLSGLSSLGAATEGLQPLSLMGGALISILCLSQTDMKVMIAYSSVAHMSLAIGCLLSATPSGAMAAMFMMLSHGVSSSAMFAGANFIYLLSHSRNLLISGGLLTLVPGMALLWFSACAGNMAAPPTVNLAAEIWSISTLMQLDSSMALAFSISSFMAAAYSLILYSSPFQGQPTATPVSDEGLPWKPVSVMAPHLLALILSLFLFI